MRSEKIDRSERLRIADEIAAMTPNDGRQHIVHPGGTRSYAMNLIIDASVAVKWLVDEPRRDQARDVLGRDMDLIAPDLILVEVGKSAEK